MTPSARAAVAVGCLIMLAGCATSADPGAAPTSQPTETAAGTEVPTSTTPTSTTPTPTTPSATPTAAPDAPPGITDVGVLDIAIGEPVPEGSPAARWTEEVCGGGVGIWKPETASAEGSRWDWDFILTPESDGGGPDAMSSDDPIGLIVVPSDGLSTAAGIHVGSTRAELEAAYPEFAAVYTNRRSSTDLYVLENETAQTVFEVVKEGAVAVSDDAVPDEIVYITIQPASVKAFSIANTDTASGCPA